MSRRSSGNGEESGSVTAEGESGTPPVSPGPAAETTGKGRVMPCERCAAPVAPAAPRSPAWDTQAGSADCDRRTRESDTGHLGSDCNSNDDCDSNRNTGGRKRRSGTNDMSRGSVANGQKGAHRHGRRDTWSGDSRPRSISSSLPVQDESHGLPLERLTQGRTGVVRLARTEPPRREAWSIFPRGIDPRMKAETGEGHRFEAKPVTQDWCDACSRQINAQALKCQSKWSCCSRNDVFISLKYSCPLGMMGMNNPLATLHLTCTAQTKWSLILPILVCECVYTNMCACFCEGAV